MLIGVAHDQVFQSYLDQAENKLFTDLRPPIAHTMRLVLTRGAANARSYLIRRGQPLIAIQYRRVYRDAYRSIQRPPGRPGTVRKANGDDDYDYDGEGLSAFLRAQLGWLNEEGGQRITGISDTVTQQIVDLMMERVAEGKSNRVIADEIYDMIPDLSEWRAATIARTETHTAALEAIDETIRFKGFDTETMQKEWLSADDDRVRESHRNAHGQRVAFDEPFQVGDTMMMRPGDDSLGAGAEEIVNCRCAILYHTRADEY